MNTEVLDVYLDMVMTLFLWFEQNPSSLLMIGLVLWALFIIYRYDDPSSAPKKSKSSSRLNKYKKYVNHKANREPFGVRPKSLQEWRRSTEEKKPSNQKKDNPDGSEEQSPEKKRPFTLIEWLCKFPMPKKEDRELESSNERIEDKFWEREPLSEDEKEDIWRNLRRYVRGSTVFRPFISRGGWDWEIREGQVCLIKLLIRQSNEYRARPLTFDECLDRMKPGVCYNAANVTIARLLNKNRVYATKYRENINASKKREHSYLEASDFGQFNFCRFSYYLKIKGIASGNVHELNAGKYYDRDDGNTPSKTESKRSSYEKMLLDEYEDIKRIEFMHDSSTKPIFHKKAKIVGKPDGLIHFKDGTSGLLEVKSKNDVTVIKYPHLSDSLQLYAYKILLEKQYRLRPQGVLLYISRDNSYYQILEVDLESVRQNFIVRYKIMLESLSKGFSWADKNLKKELSRCSSCGYRRYCSNRLKTVARQPVQSL